MILERAQENWFWCNRTESSPIKQNSKKSGGEGGVWECVCAYFSEAELLQHLQVFPDVSFASSLARWWWLFLYSSVKMSPRTFSHLFT